MKVIVFLPFWIELSEASVHPEAAYLGFVNDDLVFAAEKCGEVLYGLRDVVYAEVLQPHACPLVGNAYGRQWSSLRSEEARVLAFGRQRVRRDLKRRAAAPDPDQADQVADEEPPSNSPFNPS